MIRDVASDADTSDANVKLQLPFLLIQLLQQCVQLLQYEYNFATCDHLKSPTPASAFEVGWTCNHFQVPSILHIL